MGTIYLLIFSNGKLYVGQTRMRLEDRIKLHLAAVNGKSMGCPLVKYAWKKHGAPQVHVLEKCPVSELDEREVENIRLLDTCNRSAGYNIHAGGKNPFNVGPGRKAGADKRRGKKVSTEVLARMKAAQQNRSVEWRTNLSRALAGKSPSKDVRAKISATLTGRPGRPMSESAKGKISKANGGLARVARLAGEKYYNTGKPCKRGHMAPRYTCSRCCVECAPIDLARQKASRRAARYPLPHLPQTSPAPPAS